MKTSARGIKDLIHSEGKRNKAYRDTKGIWTIGVGHAATSGVPPIPKAGMVISDKEIEEILAKDLARFEARVNKVLGPVPQHVFDGAVSFDFNTGAIHRATWPEVYKEGNLKEAEERFMLWKKPPEIIGRRKREADLIFRGKYFTKEVETSTKPEIVPETPQPQLQEKTFVQLLFEFIVNLIKGKR